MKLFKQLSFFIVLFFTTFVYSSVQPIEIGLLGQNADAIAGAKLAIKNINAKGGVLNRSLALTSNSKATFNIIAGGNELLSQLPVIPNQKIFIATEVSLNQLPVNIITLTPNDQMQGIAAAQYISGRLYRDKAIVLYQANNTSAHALANSFDETFSATGGAVLINSSWMTSISPEVIQSIKQSNADIIYLVGDSESASAVIAELRDADIELPIMGNNTYASLIGSNQDVFFTSKAYDELPKNLNAELGYEAVQLYAQTIQSTKSIDPTKINDALHQLHQPSTVSIIKLYQNKVGIAAIIIPTLKGNHE